MLFYKNRNGTPIKVGKTFRGSCLEAKREIRRKLITKIGG